jgi:pimeloyl-ACP methyl ester carboxylesterase/DNA-binding CsgD family transcriptional regulator
VEDVRQDIRYCTSQDGVKIAYAVSGEGPPLVRVANWLTHLELDWQSTIWSHWFRELSRDNTLIRYDLRGSGLSERIVDDLTLDAWVQDLEAIINDIGIEKFDLLGLCQGGGIAMAYAVKHPDRINKLILYGSYSKGALVKGVPEEFKNEAEMLTKMIEVGWGRETSAFRRVFADLLMPDGSEEDRNWLAELEKRTVNPDMAVRLWEAFQSIDVRPCLKKIKPKTLVFHVTGDRLVPFKEGERLAQMIPDSRFVPLNSNNHILFSGEPAWQRFLAEYRSFAGTGNSSSKRCDVNHLFPELTTRYCEVFKLLATGLSNSQIAESLFISSKTVRNHIYNIFCKLQINSRAQAIVIAREAGLRNYSVESR